MGLNQDRSVYFVVRKTISKLERTIWTGLFLPVEKTLTAAFQELKGLLR
jgi:malate synthase